MRWTMSWNDTVKAAALAVQAERTATAAATAPDTRPIWNPHEVWLSRARPLRALTPDSSPGGACVYEP